MSGPHSLTDFDANMAMSVAMGQSLVGVDAFKIDPEQMGEGLTQLMMTGHAAQLSQANIANLCGIDGLPMDLQPDIQHGASPLSDYSSLLQVPSLSPGSYSGGGSPSPQRSPSLSDTMSMESEDLAAFSADVPDKRRKTAGCKRKEHNGAARAASAAEMSQDALLWSPHDRQSWCTLIDEQQNPVMMNLSIDAQKGFSYSAIDEATVCQKKNHIQVRVDVSTTSNPIAVSVPEGGQVAVSRFSVELKGIKMEAHGPAAVVSIEQSMADRSKIAFPGLPFELSAACKARLKVGRLHFSETTANNVRKKGKPNPDQRYFSLCVGIHALAVDGRTFVVQQQTSGRIIVRASNPAQFEGEGNLHWVQGSAASDVVHRGRVGINTDKPNEALAVHGNIRLTGQVLQTSDRRIKEDVVVLDARQQLQNIRDLPMYGYQLRPEFADVAGRAEGDRYEAGVMAQDVQRVMPDAVRTNGSVTLADGNVVEDLLVVNRERVFMENVGAVQQLARVTDNLEARLRELEVADSSAPPSYPSGAPPPAAATSDAAGGLVARPPSYNAVGDRRVSPAAPAEVLYWKRKLGQGYEPATNPVRGSPLNGSDSTEDDRRRWRPRRCKACGIYFCTMDRAVCPRGASKGQPCYDWSWDKGRRSQHVTLSDKDLKATCAVDDETTCHNAVGTMDLRGYSFVWQCRIDCLSPAALNKSLARRDVDYAISKNQLHQVHSTHVYLGITRSTMDYHAIPGSDADSIGWSDGMLIKDGSSVLLPGGLVPFRVGDLLGMRLDTENWTLQLFVNQQLAGSTPVPEGTYTAVVGLRCLGDSVTLLPGLPLLDVASSSKLSLGERPSAPLKI